MHKQYNFVCLNCGAASTTPDKRGAKFCSHSCNTAYQNHVHKSNTPAKFWAQVDKTGGPDACWPWIGTRNKDGYGKVGWHRRTTGAHRVAYMLQNGELPAGMDALHSCDNPPCCNPKHLFAGTNADNAADMKSKGRGAVQRPELNSQAKFGWKEVDEIRARYAAREMTQYELGALYGVAQSTIMRIIHGKRWNISKRPSTK